MQLTKHIFLTAFSACLSVGTVVYAQNPPQQPPPPEQGQGQQQQSQAGQPRTVVGCLTKGSAEHTYVVTDSKSGEKLSFAASEKIEPYLNQTVQLDGQQMSRGGASAFTPQTVKTVSSSCDGAPKK
jgi:hypothetical protein